MTAPRPTSLVLGLGAAVLAISSAALFILLAAPLPATVIAAGRVTITGIAAAVIGHRHLAPAFRVLRQPAVALRVVAAAALLAIHFGAWIASLSLTTVPRSVTLVATQPLVAGLLGRLIGDRAHWSVFAGALVAVVGTVIMVWEPDAGAVDFNQGDALALLAAVAVAAYLVVGRSVRERLPLHPYLAAVHLVAAVLLAAVAVLSEPTLWPKGTELGALGAIVVLGLLPGLVGHGLINWAVRHAPVDAVSFAILLEPLGAMVLTAAVLGRGAAPTEVLGAGVLLVGVGLGLFRRSSDE